MQQLDRMPSRKKDTERITFVLSIAGIALLIFLKELLCVADNLDEIRNYNLSRAIVMGLVPYRDFNMVMPPLFIQFMALPLLVSKTLLMCRIAHSVFLTFTMGMFYKTARGETDHRFALFVTLITIPFLDIATYNTMFFVCAMAAYIILTKCESNRAIFVMGMVTTLSALGRQTSGTLLIFAALGLLIAFSDKGKRLKRSLVYLSGAFVVGIAFLVYLLSTGSFLKFWEYCFFALYKTEGNSAFYMDGVAGLVLLVAGGLMDILRYRKTHEKKALIHLVLGLTVFTIGVPIVDLMHMVYTGLWFSLPIAVTVKELFEDKIKNLIFIVADSCAVILSLAFTFISFSGAVFVDDIDELRYVPMMSSIDSFSEIAAFNRDLESEGHRVYVFAKESALLSIINDEYNAPYDLFLKGNLGLNDPMDYVKEACSDPDNYVLMTEGYQEGDWEAPEGVYEYVTTHCHPVFSYAQYVWYVPD